MADEPLATVAVADDGSLDITTEKEYFYCDPQVEFCATDQIFTDSFKPSAAYAIMGAFVYFNLTAPLIGYLIRMAWRSVRTGTWASTSWADITALVNMIFNLVVFIYPAVMYPLQWLEDNELANFLNAWFYANFMADVLPFYWISYFVFGLIVLCSSGQGTEQVCDINGNCIYDNSYYGVGETLAQWLVWLVFNGASYFVMFWFGADAIRFLLPQGGYDLKFLYPNLIYDIMVMNGRSPDHSNELDWEHIPGVIADNKAERKQDQEDLANGVDPNADEDSTADNSDTTADNADTADSNTDI